MNEKKIYLETLRIISILCVFFNHTWTSGFLLFTQKVHSPFYPFYIGLSLMSKVAVPLFLMISGSLLLGKEDSLPSLFKKRISRIVLSLLVMAVAYYAILYFPNYSFSEFFRLLYSREIVPSQWYLYAYLGILLILPFLQSMVKSLKRGYFYYLILLHFVILGLVPIAQYLISPTLFLHRYLQVNLATPLTVFYFIIGYFIDREEKLLEKKNVMKLGIAAGISLLINILVVMLHVSKVGVQDLAAVERFHNVLILFPTLFVFVAVKQYHVTHSLSAASKERLIRWGSYTFGIYLMERFLWLTTKVVFIALDRFLPTLLACLIWVAASFFLGILVVSQLKKLPFLQRML